MVVLSQGTPLVEAVHSSEIANTYSFRIISFVGANYAILSIVNGDISV